MGIKSTVTYNEQARDGKSSNQLKGEYQNIAKFVVDLFLVYWFVFLHLFSPFLYSNRRIICLRKHQIKLFRKEINFDILLSFFYTIIDQMKLLKMIRKSIPVFSPSNTTRITQKSTWHTHHKHQKANIILKSMK